MYKIGDLAKAFDLSRSTLLYYDKIGLLKPSGRSNANYRIYTQADHDRLNTLMTYKETGLSLDAIQEILDSSGNNSSQILEERLKNLNKEISHLRGQQQLIVGLLDKNPLLRSTKIMTKAQWVDILASSGMSEDDMRLWHIEFEKSLPEAHTDFLESLGIDSDEIEKIKSWAK